MHAWRRWAAAGLAATVPGRRLVLGGGGQAPRQAAQTETRVPSPPDTELPLQTYGSMVVDPVHSHVFVTGGPGDPLVVVDFTGAVVAVMAGEAGGGAMYLDGTTLYLARPRLRAARRGRRLDPAARPVLPDGTDPCAVVGDQGGRPDLDQQPGVARTAVGVPRSQFGRHRPAAAIRSRR